MLYNAAIAGPCSLIKLTCENLILKGVRFGDIADDLEGQYVTGIHNLSIDLSNVSYKNFFFFKIEMFLICSSLTKPHSFGIGS